MKRLFTLAIVTMIAMLTFAQAPVQKSKVAGRKVQKVMTTAQMQKGMEAKAVFDAKAKAAQETSTSVLRRAAQRPSTGVTAKQMLTAPQMIPNAKVSSRVAQPLRIKKSTNAHVKAVNKVAPSAKRAPAKAEADGYVDVEASGVNATYYATGDWYYELSAGAYKFIFDIYADPEPLNGTYTWDTMDDYYSYAVYLGYYYDDFSDATFTIDADGNIDAYCTLLNTGEKYHITYTGPTAVEITSEETWAFSGDEVEVADFTATQGVLQIVGDNGDQLIGVTFNTDQPTGTFNYSDVTGIGSYTILYTSAADYDGVACFDLNATVTETGATVDYYGVNGTLYHVTFTYANGGDEPGDQPVDVTVTKDANGIITSVEGGVEKTYERATTGTAYAPNGNSVSFANQGGVVTVIEDGDKVYIKKPVSRSTRNTWVEGTKNGNMIVIPTHQPLAYNGTYDATISLRYGVISGTSIAAADDYAENIVFVVDGDTWTLQNTLGYSNAAGADAYFIGEFWDDDDTFTGYGDAETVLNYSPDYVAPETVLVELPAGVETENWTMNADAWTASTSTSTPVTGRNVVVAFDGNDVYVKGLSQNLNAWVKGTISGSTVTFKKMQFLGVDDGDNCWFIGYDGASMIDATAAYNAEAKTITFDGDILVNCAEDRIYYWEWYKNTVLNGTAGTDPVDPEPGDDTVITNLTASLPYVNSFDTTAEQGEAAIYDANADGKTWTFNAPSNGDNTTTAVRYTYNSSKDADDYVVFPGLALEAGKSYKVSVDARANGTIYPEKIEVVTGTEATVPGLSTVVIPETVLSTATYQTLTVDFTPEVAGTYYFALHATSEKDMFYLFADNFSVKENNPNTPNAATAFTAEAGAEGALTAKLTFTLPSTTVGGATIDDYVEYEIARDGEVVIQGAAQAGSTKSKTDDKAHNGINNYTLVVKYNNLTSDPIATSVFVGEDELTDVVNLEAVDHNTTVGLTWDAPTEGKNGGYINPANITYNVYPVEIYELMPGWEIPMVDTENPYMTGLTETSAEVDYDTNVGDQAYNYLAVTAENPAGETSGALAAILTGAPYELPFHEGLTGQALHYWWGTACDDDNYDADGGLYFSTTESSDGDDVSFAFVAQTAGWIDMYSGKIALDGAENPGLSFDYKAEGPVKVDVLVTTPEGETTVETINATASDEYQTVKVSLKDFVAQPWVKFTIRGTFEEATNLYVDNVNVMDVIADNLSIKISAPSKVVAGKSVTVKAIVKNEGENDAEGYEVKFYVNDNEAPTPLFETPALGFLETADFEFELETSVFDTTGDVVVKAEVVYAADLKDADNADETVVEVVEPTATPVSSVTAEETEDGVLVSWTVDEATSQEVTEDFESYDSFAYDSFGDWTAVSVDGQTTGGFFQNYEYPGQGEPFGWMVFSPEEVFEGLVEANPTMAPHSGDKYAMAPYGYIGETFYDNDKWLFSPALAGVAQTISFYAGAIDAEYPSTIEILYSTTDKSINSFTSVKTVVLECNDNDGWVEVTADLPEGAKYFAIRDISDADHAFMTRVDDITYTAGTATATGYNIYVDGNLVATVDGDASSYTYDEDLTDGTHEFSVTAVYGDNESLPVTATLDVTTGIININTNAADVEIYSVDGIRMTGMKNLKAGVYVVNGQKVVIK